MCNQILKNGNICKKSKNKDLCHIHDKIKQINNINEIQKKLSLKEIEIKNLNKSLEKKSFIIKDLQKYRLMEDDFNKYQIIKKFTIIKDKLKQYFGNKQPYKIINNIYNKEKLEKIFKMDYYDIPDYYNNLRNKRITYAHF